MDKFFLFKSFFFYLSNTSYTNFTALLRSVDWFSTLIWLSLVDRAKLWIHLFFQIPHIVQQKLMYTLQILNFSQNMTRRSWSFKKKTYKLPSGCPLVSLSPRIDLSLESRFFYRFVEKIVLSIISNYYYK